MTFDAKCSGAFAAISTCATAALFLGLTLVPFVRPDILDLSLDFSSVFADHRAAVSRGVFDVPDLRSASTDRVNVRPKSPPDLAAPGSAPAFDGRWWRVEAPQSTPNVQTVVPSGDSVKPKGVMDVVSPGPVLDQHLMRQPVLPPLALENAIPSVMRTTVRFVPPRSEARLGATVPKDIRRWELFILRSGKKYDIDPNLIAALMQTESAGNASAFSTMNAVGLMQVMGGAFEPEANIDQGVSIFARHLRAYGVVDLALAAYNAGPGAVATYGGIPPYEETLRHVSRTLASYQSFKGE